MNEWSETRVFIYVVWGNFIISTVNLGMRISYWLAIELFSKVWPILKSKQLQSNRRKRKGSNEERNDRREDDEIIYLIYLLIKIFLSIVLLRILGSLHHCRVSTNSHRHNEKKHQAIGISAWHFSTSFFRAAS